MAEAGMLETILDTLRHVEATLRLQQESIAALSRRVDALEALQSDINSHLVYPSASGEQEGRSDG